MRKRFVTNLFFLLILNLFVKSFWILGIDREVQNVLSADSYGLYFALLNFSFLFNILLDFGLTNYNNKTIAQNPYILKKYMAQLVPIKFAMAAVFALVVGVSAYVLGYDSYSIGLLSIMCVSQFLASFLTYLRSNVTGLLMFKTDAFLSILDRLLLIGFCALLLWTNLLGTEFKVEYFVWSQFFAYLINVLVALFVCLRKTGFMRLRWNKPFVFKIIKDSYPYAVLGLLMTFYNRVDSIMIERILPDGKEQSGVYASAFRLVDAANMVAYLFSVILLPLFSNIIAKKENPQPIVKISFHILLLLTVGFFIVSHTYSYDLMDLMYNKHIAESAEIYKVLSFCFIPIGMTYIFGTLLTANGSLKYLNMVASLGMILNIGINFILIPRFDALGAAYSSFIAQTITSLLQAIIAIRIFKIRFDFLYFIRIISFIISLSLIAFALNGLTGNWIYDIVLTLVLMVGASFIFGVFKIKDVFLLFKQEK